MKEKKYYMAFYKVEGFKGEILFMNKDFKKRYNTIEELEKTIKEKAIKNAIQYNIYEYIEKPIKQIKVN